VAWPFVSRIRFVQIAWPYSFSKPRISHLPHFAADGDLAEHRAERLRVTGSEIPA